MFICNSLLQTLGLGKKSRYVKSIVKSIDVQFSFLFFFFLFVFPPKSNRDKGEVFKYYIIAHYQNETDTIS